MNISTSFAWEFTPLPRKMTRLCVGAAGGGGGVDGGEEDACGAPQILVSIKECSGVHQCAMDQTLLPIRTNIYISTLEAQYRTPRETDVIYSSASMLSFPSDPTGATATGTQFTCFTGTKVQILTRQIWSRSRPCSAQIDERGLATLAEV